MPPSSLPFGQGSPLLHERNILFFHENERKEDRHQALEQPHGFPDGIEDYLSCEDALKQRLQETDVSEKHLHLLSRCRDEKMSLRAKAGSTSILLKKGKETLGEVTHVRPHALWKGDLLLALQKSLVDIRSYLNTEEYEKTQALQMAEFQQQLLSQVAAANRLPEAQRSKFDQQIQKILGIDEDVITIKTLLPPSQEGTSRILQVLVISKEHPGKIFGVFEIGDMQSMGAHNQPVAMKKIAAINLSPPPDELPSSTMISYLSSLAGVRQNLSDPSIEMQQNGQRLSLKLFTQERGRKREVATITFDARSGDLLTNK